MICEAGRIVWGVVAGENSKLPEARLCVSWDCVSESKADTYDRKFNLTLYGMIGTDGK